MVVRERRTAVMAVYGGHGAPIEVRSQILQMGSWTVDVKSTIKEILYFYHV